MQYAVIAAEACAVAEDPRTAATNVDSAMAGVFPSVPTIPRSSWHGAPYHVMAQPGRATGQTFAYQAIRFVAWQSGTLFGASFPLEWHGISDSMVRPRSTTGFSRLRLHDGRSRLEVARYRMIKNLICRVHRVSCIVNPEIRSAHSLNTRLQRLHFVPVTDGVFLDRGLRPHHCD